MRTRDNPPKAVATLRGRRDRARARVDELDREIRALDRKRRLASARVAQIENRLGAALVRAWGDTPDWRAILAHPGEGGTIVRAAGAAALARLGLTWGEGVWDDTNEPVIAIRFSRASAKTALLVETSVRTLGRYLRKRPGGIVWFALLQASHPGESWRLVHHRRGDTADLVGTAPGRTDVVITFPTLLAALVHAQQHLWYDETGAHDDLVVTQAIPAGTQLVML